MRPGQAARRWHGASQGLKHRAASRERAAQAFGLGGGLKGRRTEGKRVLLTRPRTPNSTIRDSPRSPTLQTLFHGPRPRLRCSLDCKSLGRRGGSIGCPRRHGRRGPKSGPPKLAPRPAREGRPRRVALRCAALRYAVLCYERPLASTCVAYRIAPCGATHVAPGVMGRATWRICVGRRLAEFFVLAGPPCLGFSVLVGTKLGPVADQQCHGSKTQALNSLADSLWRRR